MPKSAVYRKRLAHAQSAKRKKIGGQKQTKKSPKIGRRGPSTLKSHRFLGGYE